MQLDNQAAEAELQAALKGHDVAKREHDNLGKKHQTALQNMKVRSPPGDLFPAGACHGQPLIWLAWTLLPNTCFLKLGKTAASSHKRWPTKAEPVGSP